MYSENGYFCFPAARGGKGPAIEGVNWQDLATNDAKQVQAWISLGFNLGVSTQNFWVYDIDVKERARAFYESHKHIITTIVETRRGAHFYFGGKRGGAKGDGEDIKGDGGYVLGAGSIVDGWIYRFATPLVRVEELKEFPNFEPKKRAITRKVRDAARYVMGIESIQGSAGSKGLVRACAVLRDAGYTEAQAMAVLIDWNKNGTVLPPWSLDELARACSNTYSKGV